MEEDIQSLCLEPDITITSSWPFGLTNSPTIFVGSHEPSIQTLLGEIRDSIHRR